MEQRIREILEEQIGNGVLVGGARKKRKVARKRSTKTSPWITYLKCASKKLGIPYNQLMTNKYVRDEYHAMVRGSGASVGGALVGGKKLTKKQRKVVGEKVARKNKRSGNKKVNSVTDKKWREMISRCL